MTDQPAQSAAAPTDLKGRLWLCVRDGVHKGLRTSLWLIAIMAPVSLVVTLLQYSGVLAALAPYLQPVFHYLGLPAESVIPCITAAFLNVYSGIGALSAIALTDRQLTILAMMILISHNLPVESAIQHKAGTPLWRMVFLRLAMSLVAAALMNLILPAGDGVARTRGLGETAAGFWPMLTAWAIGIGLLAAKICAIVMGLMILQRLLREFKIVDLLAIPLTPVLWLLGLPRRLAFLWIVANTLGLAYGSAVILDEVESGALTRPDAQLLNRSIGICHSLLEDTLLFVAIGAWAFWITMPRLALAAVVVWIYRAITTIALKRRAGS